MGQVLAWMTVLWVETRISPVPSPLRSACIWASLACNTTCTRQLFNGAFHWANIWKAYWCCQVRDRRPIPTTSGGHKTSWASERLLSSRWWNLSRAGVQRIANAHVARNNRSHQAWRKDTGPSRRTLKKMAKADSNRMAKSRLYISFSAVIKSIHCRKSLRSHIADLLADDLHGSRPVWLNAPAYRLA